jgi:hypothetical protein
MQILRQSQDPSAMRWSRRGRRPTPCIPKIAIAKSLPAFRPAIYKAQDLIIEKTGDRHFQNHPGSVSCLTTRPRAALIASCSFAWSMD